MYGEQGDDRQKAAKAAIPPYRLYPSFMREFFKIIGDLASPPPNDDS